MMLMVMATASLRLSASEAAFVIGVLLFLLRLSASGAGFASGFVPCSVCTAVDSYAGAALITFATDGRVNGFTKTISK
jgi:ascorbate-specific PTS system EIIC-type component UlaA